MTTHSTVLHHASEDVVLAITRLSNLCNMHSIPQGWIDEAMRNGRIKDAKRQNLNRPIVAKMFQLSEKQIANLEKKYSSRDYISDVYRLVDTNGLTQVAGVLALIKIEPMTVAQIAAANKIDVGHAALLVQEGVRNGCIKKTDEDSFPAKYFATDAYDYGEPASDAEFEDRANRSRLATKDTRWKTESFSVIANLGIAGQRSVFEFMKPKSGFRPTRDALIRLDQQSTERRGADGDTNFAVTAHFSETTAADSDAKTHMQRLLSQPTCPGFGMFTTSACLDDAAVSHFKAKDWPTIKRELEGVLQSAEAEPEDATAERRPFRLSIAFSRLRSISAGKVVAGASIASAAAAALYSVMSDPHWHNSVMSILAAVTHG